LTGHIPIIRPLPFEVQLSTVQRSSISDQITTTRKTLNRRGFLRLAGAGLAGIIMGSAYFAMKSDSVTQDGALAKFEPEDEFVYTGVALTRPLGHPDVEKAVQEWNKWTNLMEGKPAAISHEYTWFNNQANYAYDYARARGAVPMISIVFTKASTKEIANAGTSEDGRRTDLLILHHADAAREFKDKVIVRLGHEMNGHWYPYCAYDQDGTPRANTTEDYKRAWRRVVTIFRGGYVRDINTKLADYGLPPLDRHVYPPTYRGRLPVDELDAYLSPVENAAFVWCPNYVSMPYIVGNAAAEYYPGDDVVDWVGQDVYYAPWWEPMDVVFSHMDDFYREFVEWRGKPYMLGEWALRPPGMGPEGTTTNDHPFFIDRVLDWSKTRPRVKALVYYSWDYSPEGNYELQRFPKSAKSLAEGWKDRRFLH
jgi:mannan endo-1,4-beta-mannosidase